MIEQSSALAPFLLIYRFDLSSPDGTSVQLRRMFAGFSRPGVHVFETPAEPKYAAFSLPALVKIRFADPAWRFRVRGPIVRSWWRRLIGPTILRSRFGRAVSAGGQKDVVAYTKRL